MASIVQPKICNSSRCSIKSSIALIVTTLSFVFCIFLLFELKNLRHELNTVRQNCENLSLKLHQRKPGVSQHPLQTDEALTHRPKDPDKLVGQQITILDVIRRVERSRRQSGTKKKKKDKKPAASGIKNGEKKTKNNKRHGKKQRGNAVEAASFVSQAGPMNPKGIIDDWQYAEWMTSKMQRKFKLGKSTPDKGKITITSDGLYYISAQITYRGTNDSEFAIVAQLNKTETRIACCIQSLHLSKTDSSVMSSCHTSGLVMAKKNDQIYIYETMGQRGATFEGPYSHVSIIKLRSLRGLT